MGTSAFPLIISPKWRTALARTRSAKEGRGGRFTLLATVGAIFWLIIFGVLFRVLRYFRGVEEIGPLLAGKLLSLVLLSFLAILLLSNVITALSSFFLAKDLDLLASSPVDWLHLYLAKLGETLVHSSWMVALMAVPIFVVKAAYLPRIAAGELRLQAFAVTEPTSGTDTSRIRTTAVRDGDAYVVNGQKVWTSRAEHSDLMLLLARTAPREAGEKPHDGMSVFLLDMRQALGHGLSIRPLRAMINHHTTEVFFDELRIPADSLIGEEGRGFRYLLDGLNAERILIAAEAIGDARWFIEKARTYATERVVFDRPIGQNQGIQFPIARAYAATEAADLMVKRAAALFDAGEACGAEANMAKLLAADASWQAADMCLQTHGGFGFAEEYDVERKFRETRLFQVAPISTNLVLAYLAEHVLGLPRSY